MFNRDKEIGSFSDFADMYGANWNHTCPVCGIIIPKKAKYCSKKCKMAWGLQTYTDGTTREDLLDVLKDIQPAQAPFKSGLKTLLDSVIEDEKTKRNNNKEKLKNLLKSV